MLMSNTVTAKTKTPFARCDWCGTQRDRLLILPTGNGNRLLRCTYACRRRPEPTDPDDVPEPEPWSTDGRFDRQRGCWTNTAPEYCRWCGGRFHQWIITWNDSMELESPHCGKCEVAWGDAFACAELDDVHRHEYHYSEDWRQDSQYYFDGGDDPVEELLEAGAMPPESMYCMEPGNCGQRSLTVPEFVARYGVMGRSWIFANRMQRLDEPDPQPFDGTNCWDFRRHQSVTPPPAANAATEG